MEITGAQAIIESFRKEGVKTIFGYPGAAICPFYDALYESGIRHVLTRTEQGAVHAASGYARVTGKTGVCIATSGPGATNTITGIATAYMDSIPVVVITGQVPTGLIGRDVFQEADITGATLPFCKHNYLVRNAKDLPRIIKEAFHIASTGRPGPVLIDVPIDVQMGVLDFKYPEKVDIPGYKPTYKGHVMQIKRATDAVSKAKRPVICAGGGIITANASAELVVLAEAIKAPVLTTLMGIGAIPSSHKLYMGMLGSHGSKAANQVLAKADLLLIMGARVGDRAMGAASEISERAVVIHMDIDPAEIGKNICTHIPIVGDIKQILAKFLEHAAREDCEKWLDECMEAREKYEAADISDEYADWVNPKAFLKMLSGIVADGTVLTTEVGQNQIWAANNYMVRKPRTFISSGGLGTMGYGLPSSIGAKVGKPASSVIVISGDGSFQMMMQELGTIKQEKLDIKIIIFNNSRLGMVRELQKVKYCGRYSQVAMESNPDFMKLAEAYGFKGERLLSDIGAKDAVKRMLGCKGAYILECIVNPEAPTL